MVAAVIDAYESLLRFVLNFVWRKDPHQDLRVSRKIHVLAEMVRCLTLADTQSTMQADTSNRLSFAALTSSMATN